MTQILELPELLENDRETEMDVRSRGVDSELHTERATEGQTAPQLALRQAINGVSGQPGSLLSGLHADRAKYGQKGGAPVQESIRRNARLPRPTGTFAVAFLRLANGSVAGCIVAGGPTRSHA